jgi:hypothetical protein
MYQGAARVRRATTLQGSSPISGSIWSAWQAS